MNWNNDIKILGHRGYMSKFPENSIQAFKEALKDGAEGLELDVWLTQDNEVIVMHDDTINRTTDLKGKQKNMALKELKKADLGSGERIPTLQQVLRKFPDAIINIEIKDPDAVEKTLKIIDELNAEERILISSFNREILLETRKFNKNIKIGFLVANFLNLAFIPSLDSEIDLYSINLPMEWVYLSLGVFKKILQWIKNMGIKIALWTQDDELYYKENNLNKLLGLFDILISNNIKKTNSYIKGLRMKNK